MGFGTNHHLRRCAFHSLFSGSMSDMAMYRQLSRDSPICNSVVGSPIVTKTVLKGARDMYGVPPALDLSRFKDAVFIQLCVGEFQLQFHFHPCASISVEGKWELRDESGSLVDGSERGAKRDALYAHRLLGKKVNGFSLDAPTSFSLRFESGHVLTIFDDSRQYESFSIQPGDVFV